MKKLLLLFAVMGIATFANAQYKKFKVDMGFGYAIPSGTGAKAGATFTLEPHYRLSDDLSVGLRIEGAALGYQTGTSTSTDVKISILSSYCPSAEYYLMDGGFRPFVGAGLGFYSQASLSANSSTGGAVVSVPGSSKFGFFPRVGIEAGHFRLSGEYNSLGSGSSYTAFKIGFFLGGGKK